MNKFALGWKAANKNTIEAFMLAGQVTARKATPNESLKNLLYVLGFTCMLWANYALFLSQTKYF